MCNERYFSIFTLGCKLNQLESEAVAGSFRKAGFRLVPWDSCPGEPRILIVNTCTVTSKADQKARRMIRKILKENPESCVIVTGCYAQLDAEEITALEVRGETSERRLFALAGGEGAAAAATAAGAKSALLVLPQYMAEALAISPDMPLPRVIEAWTARAEKSAVNNDSLFDFKPDEFSFHSRGYLKIQDGCDNSCAYCRVRLARGHSVSLNSAAVLERLRACEAKGCAEIFITGVNLTQYRDDDAGIGLAGLLDMLLDGTSAIALRLSSLEPECIDEKLVSALASPRIRPHFHLSAQSGSDAVLKSMGRAYDLRALERAIKLLRSAKDNPFLACDIIAGFPGETESEFAKTLAFCEESNFAWIHAFPYSRRPGTAAFSSGDPVREIDKTRRVETLGGLALRGKRAYAQAWLGKELSAVVEKDKPGGAKAPCGARQCRAVSENYLKLLVSCNGEAPTAGSAIRCVPVSVGGGGDVDAVAEGIGEGRGVGV